MLSFSTIYSNKRQSANFYHFYSSKIFYIKKEFIYSLIQFKIFDIWTLVYSNIYDGIFSLSCLSNQWVNRERHRRTRVDPEFAQSAYPA